MSTTISGTVSGALTSGAQAVSTTVALAPARAVQASVPQPGPDIAAVAPSDASQRDFARSTPPLPGAASQIAGEILHGIGAVSPGLAAVSVSAAARIANEIAALVQSAQSESGGLSTVA